MRTAFFWVINPLNAELNPIRHLLALVGARHIVHLSRVRVKQQVVVISYRRFGLFGFLTPEDGTDRLSRNIGRKLPLLAVL